MTLGRWTESRGVYAGFDVGGTFTDVVVVDGTRHVIAKVLTTPDDPSVGVRHGISQALEALALSLDDIDVAVHGTTLVANAIIERKGAHAALLTNNGMRDLIEIGTGTRYDIYDLHLPFPEPLIERRLRREIAGRIDADGVEVEPLDETEVSSVLREFASGGIDAVAVCLLHSYRNGRHEQRVAELAQRLYPKMEITTSADLAGKLGEYERFSTAIANAYVQPLVRGYVRSLEDWLQSSRLLLMGSSGGTVGVKTAVRWPIRLIESGPAAGALGAAAASARLGRESVVSFDMGGTTAKICVIDAGAPSQTDQLEVARQERFKPGSGIPLSVPTFELLEIGAGGGSIARVDDLELLKVGPKSAGADPGPACYGRGGADPTVTDANLILGYLDAESFLGGDMTLHRKAATGAVERVIGRRMGLTPVEAAWGIHEIVNEAMAAALRTHLVERNRDPRLYSLLAFGGAGPTHAVAVARKVGIREVVIPLSAGALSAIGLVIAPPVIDLIQTHVWNVEEIDWQKVREIYDSLEFQAQTVLSETGAEGEVRIERSVDMRYVGQSHEITIVLSSEFLTGNAQEAMLTQQFRDRYKDLYTHLNPEFAVETLHWRLRAVGARRTVTIRNGMGKNRVDGNQSAGPRALRLAYFSSSSSSSSSSSASSTGFVDTPVLTHEELVTGSSVVGPALIEQREATTLIGPADRAIVGDDLDLLIRVGGNS
jgi:N-methylhydantoinase A/oxoprolinase/acetone carboxylase beta subunit